MSFSALTGSQDRKEQMEQQMQSVGGGRIVGRDTQYTRSVRLGGRHHARSFHNRPTASRNAVARAQQPQEVFQGTPFRNIPDVLSGALTLWSDFRGSEQTSVSPMAMAMEPLT